MNSKINLTRAHKFKIGNERVQFARMDESTSRKRVIPFLPIGLFHPY